MDYAALFSENSLCSWSFSLLAATTAWPQSISMLTLLSLILYFKAEERLNLDPLAVPLEYYTYFRVRWVFKSTFLIEKTEWILET